MGVLKRQDNFDSPKRNRIFCVAYTQIHALDLWSPNKNMCPGTVTEFDSSPQVFMIKSVPDPAP